MVYAFMYLAETMWTNKGLMIFILEHRELFSHQIQHTLNKPEYCFL